MTDAEALDLVRVWWAKSVPLLNYGVSTEFERGFRPQLEPTRYGWALYLRGPVGRFVEGVNLFDGHTVAEAVEKARETVERRLA